MFRRRLHWLAPAGDPHVFPDPKTAVKEPNGLLAAGGDLSAERLIAAYGQGIFPWYQDGQPILWWSPDPRAVLFPNELHVSRSLRRKLKRGTFDVSFDQAFGEVIAGCAAPRPIQTGETWITADMAAAYTRLFDLGCAHSVEVWHAGTLVGGLYGVALGGVFFGESMFARMTDASKVALVHLVRRLSAWNFELIDCQVESAHLATLGSRPIARATFLQILARNRAAPSRWRGVTARSASASPAHSVA
jgi:leucyl/phenylalanyl-tRNA--protein transferase